MCGIAGFIDFKSDSSLETLKKCTDALSHRGPDGSGYEILPTSEAQVALGHRRLSIIDLSTAGAQPMHYKDLSIIFNGEIYNYAEIKKELEALGHVFISHSDTEVILHAYEQWAEEMLHRFIGMFAFAIYDGARKELVCFRDRAGVKPFYYYWTDDLFLFGSELKAFHHHPRFKRSVNLQAVYQFVQYGYIMAPLTIFENTNKLLPGHYLKLNLRTKQAARYKYWDVNDAYHQRLDISEEEALEEAERLLRSSCNYRMVADVPVGVFLSGGYDSSAVTALLQKDRAEKIRTFTIGFHEEGYNESVHAREVASYLGTDHTEYYCTTKEAQDIIPQIPQFCDEPFGDSSIIPTTLVSRLAREKVTVALSADAGDETFAGYPKHSLALGLLQKVERVPKMFRGGAGTVMNLLPERVVKMVTRNGAAGMKKERLAKILTSNSPTATHIMDVLLSQNYSSSQMNRLMHEKLEAPASAFDEDKTLNGLDPLNKLLAIDYKTYLVDDILTKVDRATMSTSLEGREPLLDHRLIEFVAKLPAQYKLKGNVQKYLLKKIVHKYVPPSLMERPKMGFSVPVYDWLRHELKFYDEQYMTQEKFSVHGIFNWQEVNLIRKEFFAGSKHYNTLYWHLLMFQLWFEEWM
jgi:asparagine synthase (glutamine-hydrolysing)